MKQKCVLIITDGVGCNPSREFNAFAAARKPTYEELFESVPNALLRTSGEAVGLPCGQMGNSEVGHMCIGSGRVIYQNLVRINRALEDGSLRDNARLRGLLKRCKKVHVIGLYSDGGVHSHLRHFRAMLELCKEAGAEVFAHAISDGRDVPPKTGAEFVRELEDFCAKKGVRFASLCGRFYAMDRDRRWERVRAYYECLRGRASRVQSLSAAVRSSYEAGVYDEFIEPVIAEGFEGVAAEDGLIFVNFRNDRMKELVEALHGEDFREFERDEIFKNCLTMTVYDDKFQIPALFEKERLPNTLAEVISRAGLSQLHTAETEKYAHVTFFFNGGREELLENETRVLIPSPKVKTYNETPAMSAFEVCEAVKNGMERGEDFIVVNFANGDMVGHTGDFAASVEAVEAVDACLGEIVRVARREDYAFIITSDHGNCEAMEDAAGNVLTNHTTFDVFVFVEAKICKKLRRDGGLSNVAASVLKILGLEIPAEMDPALF